MNRHLRIEEKLTALREADSFRGWESLDDKRLCVLCGRVISGRMIDVWQDSHRTFHLHCPTPGCQATPRDWFYHSPARTAARVTAQRPLPVLS